MRWLRKPWVIGAITGVVYAIITFSLSYWFAVRFAEPMILAFFVIGNYPAIWLLEFVSHLFLYPIEDTPYSLFGILAADGIICSILFQCVWLIVRTFRPSHS